MSRAPIAWNSRYLYCIQPHTHALLRFRVHRVTASHISYFAESGVAVDKATGEPLGRASEGGEGSVIIVAQDRLDAERAYEGAPPDHASFYSSFDAFQRLWEVALVRYDTTPPEPVDHEAELDLLRRHMMDSHPDHGGTEEAFTAARAAYEAVRRREPDRGE